MVFLLLETNMCFHYHSSIKPFDQERFLSERDLSHGKWCWAELKEMAPFRFRNGSIGLRGLVHRHNSGDHELIEVTASLSS